MKKNTYKVALLAVTLVALTAGFSSEVQKKSLNKSFIHTTFEALPLNGMRSDDLLPFSTLHSFPFNKGSISTFSPLMPTHEELSEMRWSSNRIQNAGKKITQEEIDQLSTSEKFDLYRGQYDYPLTHEILKNIHPNQPDWIDLQFGCSVAAIHFAEPTAITVTSKENILIHFSENDLKGLLCYHYDKVVLQKLNIQKFKSSASDFHLALTTFIGLKDKGLILERMENEHSTYQAIAGYHSTVLSQNQNGDLLIQTTLDLADKSSMTYRYHLQLDQNNQIIEGSFEEGSEQPESLISVSKTAFDKTFDALNEIYSPKVLNYVK